MKFILLRGLYHQLDGQEFEQTIGDSEGQGSLECCSSRSHRVGHDLVTENSNSISELLELRIVIINFGILLSVIFSNVFSSHSGVLILCRLYHLILVQGS